MKNNLITIFILLIPLFTVAQKPSEFLPDKPGKWTYSSNIKRPGAEVLVFNKNLAVLAEWFHQNVPMLTNPKGFDLLAASFGIWDDDYKRNACNYGMRSEMNFDFQLFLSDLARGGKWVVEPPHYSFYINNTEGGHGTNPNYKYFSEQEYDPRGDKKYSTSQQKAINDVVTKMNGVFSVFPLKEDIAPGVKLFGGGNLIVFNPQRPDFWLPVTMREMVDMYLEYYTLQKDEFTLPYLRKEIEGISEEEMNAAAFSGNDNRDILRFNGNAENLQIMRFNPEYWDRTLPKSAIQFLTFGYNEFSQKDKEVHFKNNGYPIYGNLIMHSIKLEDLHGLITKKK